MEIVFEELVIPLLLIPTYFAIFYARASKYRLLLGKIEGAKDADELIDLEKRSMKWSKKNESRFTTV